MQIGSLVNPMAFATSTVSRCRYLRFTLRAALVTFTAVAIPLGWRVNIFREEKAAAAAIARCGGDANFFGGPMECFTKWGRRVGFRRSMQSLLPYVSSVDFQGYDGHGGTSDCMKHLRAFRWIGSLRIHLGLALEEATITPAALREIAALKQLRDLDLSGAAISDADVAILYNMRGLDSISLPDQISDAAAEKLQRRLPKLLILSHGVGRTATLQTGIAHGSIRRVASNCAPRGEPPSDAR